MGQENLLFQHDFTNFIAPHRQSHFQAKFGQIIRAIKRQLIVAALYVVFDQNRELTSADLLQEAGNIVPLSVMMSEEIAELRSWAQMRTRPASNHGGD